MLVSERALRLGAELHGALSSSLLSDGLRGQRNGVVPLQNTHNKVSARLQLRLSVLGSFLSWNLKREANFALFKVEQTLMRAEEGFREMRHVLSLLCFSK